MRQYVLLYMTHGSDRRGFWYVHNRVCQSREEAKLIGEDGTRRYFWRAYKIAATEPEPLSLAEQIDNLTDPPKGG
jgi:hypothetical protein